jgi:CRISPR system Cascade subunit CasE
MYLSRLILNPRSAEVRRDLASPYELHRTLKSSYPPDREPEGNRMLFRVEQDQRYQRNHIAVLVQTLVAPPDWSRLPAGYCLDIDLPKEIDPSFATGDLLAFRLDANAVVKHQRENERTGSNHSKHTRMGIRTEEGQRNWLLTRAEARGFRVMYLNTNPFLMTPARGVIPNNQDKRSIPHFGVHYDGLLEVQNPEAFKETLRNGLGPARAFGFGMMVLSRAV